MSIPAKPTVNPAEKLKTIVSSAIPMITVGLVSGQPFLTTLIGSMIMPVMIMIFDYLWERGNKVIAEKTDSRVEEKCRLTISEKQEFGGSVTISNTYEPLRWYLEKKLFKKVKSTQVKSFKKNGVIIDGYGVDQKEIKNFPFEWKNDEVITEILVTFGIHPKPEDEKSAMNQLDEYPGSRYIVLEHEDRKVLTDFIEQGTLDYTTTMSTEIRLPKIFKHVKQGSYNNHVWSSTDMNVKKNLSNLFLRKKTKKLFTNDIINYPKMKNVAESMGTPYKRGYMFYGLPGCGKTSAVYALAGELNRNVYIFSLSKLKESDFEYLISYIPKGSILSFEDIDTAKVTHKREKHTLSDGGSDEFDIGCLLKTFDGYENLSDCIITMTTNYPEKLDSALIREGRIDIKIEFETCDFYQLKKIVTHVFGKTLRDDILKDVDPIKLENKNFKVAEVINAWVMPNFSDWNAAREKILEKVNS